MIIVENSVIKEIPLLHVVHKDKYEKQLPFIMFIHGFESTKEKNLHYAYLLAQRGFRVILPEAIHHGERQTGLTEQELNMSFWDIVLTTIDELNTMKEYYEKENLILPESIGLAGTSMGAIVTLGALTQYSWIKAAVSLMGMPYYEQFATMQLQELDESGQSLSITESEKEAIFTVLRKYDISIQTEKLANRPLLFWHGVKDLVVPYKYTYHFFENIRPLYLESPEKLQFISDENADHNVSKEGVQKLVDWFEKYVHPSGVMEVTTKNFHSL